ncbi:MAG TPA: DUF4340 domain-containing protein [Kofleriaceae bacterium]|jgi:hypothetical protein
MRGALIHGILLAVMLVYGYRTWTRDKTAEPAAGSVALWTEPETDLVSIELKSPKKIMRIERKPEGYWWGVDTTIELKPKPVPAGSNAGSAGSAGSGAGSAAKPVIEEEEVGRKTHEFPLGEPGDTMIKDWSDARAMRDLGVPNAETKKDYKLDDAKTTIVVTFKNGTKTLLVGGSVYGGSDRYAVDEASGKAYVLPKEMISGLELGESSLHLTDPRGFDNSKVGSVTIEAGNRTKTVARIEAESDGKKQKTWGDADTKTPNQTAANFVDNANNLKPSEYDAKLKPSDMTQVLKLTYKSDNGGNLGTLTLYKFDKPGELPPDAESFDPANPPKGETQYYIVTEKTHIPGLVRKDSAQRMENDIDTVFSGKAEGSAGSGAGSAHSAVAPHGNPFGKGPLPKIGSAAPPVPVAPGAGSAAKVLPAHAGSAAPAAKISPTAAGSAAH